MPTLKKETQKCSVIFTRENMYHVYILTCECYPLWHTHLQKMLCVYNLQSTIFVMVKKQMHDDACVYLNSYMCKCDTKKQTILCDVQRKPKVKSEYISPNNPTNIYISINDKTIYLIIQIQFIVTQKQQHCYTERI